MARAALRFHRADAALGGTWFCFSAAVFIAVVGSIVSSRFTVPFFCSCPSRGSSRMVAATRWSSARMAAAISALSPIAARSIVCAICSLVRLELPVSF